MSQNIDFRLLYEANYRALCLFATHFTGDIDESEDIVQECFMRLYEKSTEGAAIDDTRAYLYGAVRNSCLMAIRRRASQHEVVGGEEGERRLATDLRLVVSDENIARSERESRLWTAIEQLPQRCRDILIMAKRDGMKYSEIAAELHISVKTVENQMSKAFKVLRGKHDDILGFVLTFMI